MDIGTQTGALVFTFEDTYSVVHEIRKEFTVEVMEMVIDDPGIYDPGMEDPGMVEPGEEVNAPFYKAKWFIPAAVGAGVLLIVIIVVIVVIVKKRKQKDELGFDE